MKDIYIIGGLFLAIYSVVMLIRGGYRAAIAYNSWSLRNHPIEKLLRRTIDLIQTEPTAFTARHDITVEVVSNKYQTRATRSNLRIQGENVPLNDYQEARLKKAVDALYASNGGTAKQFLPLWLNVSGATKVIAGNFRKRA